MRSQRVAILVSIALLIAGGSGCSNSDSSDIKVLDLAPPTEVGDPATDGEAPETGDEEVPNAGSGAEATSPDGAATEQPDGDLSATVEGTPTEDAEEPDGREIADEVAKAVMSTSNVTLETKIEDGAEIVGRTACTGIPDTSTQYPIGLELILGPPGQVGSGTPRIVIRSYDDPATAEAASRARIASMESCIASASQVNQNFTSGIEEVNRPIDGQQLWFPAGAMTETHNAYSIGPYYIVASNRVPSDNFVAGQVDAWSVSAVQRVIDTLEAETAE